MKKDHVNTGFYETNYIVNLTFVVDLQAQISSAERKNKRLKEVFAQKIQEFREACYSLTGYRIDVVQDQQYKLKSMYAERSSDCLLFQVCAGRKLCNFF